MAMGLPSARVIITGVVISLIALWAYNNIAAVNRLVGPRQ